MPRDTQAEKLIADDATRAANPATYRWLRKQYAAASTLAPAAIWNEIVTTRSSGLPRHTTNGASGCEIISAAGCKCRLPRSSTRPRTLRPSVLPRSLIRGRAGRVAPITLSMAGLRTAHGPRHHTFETPTTSARRNGQQYYVMAILLHYHSV